MATDIATWVGFTLSDGRYQVTAKLGEGGMGVVYRAVDHRLETDVVIKAPRRAMLEDPAFAGRFAREIRSLVQLVHPHIVKVMDVGEHDGLPFAVMQYLSGGSVRDRQPTRSDGQPRPMPADSLRSWLEPVADALDFIHRKGYIHRDIKPDNILFDAENHAYLSDFGVAKVLSQQDDQQKKRTALTGSGMILGTPQFMAPELIMGQQFDGRVDQYALGVMVYELLSGQYPFDGASPVAIYMQHTTTVPVPLDKLLPGIPSDLAFAVRKAMAKDPNERYPDCTSFARDVLALCGMATTAPEARAERRVVTCPACRKPFEWPGNAERVRCPSCGKGLHQSSRSRGATTAGRTPETKMGSGTVATSAPPITPPPQRHPDKPPRPPVRTTAGSAAARAQRTSPAQDVLVAGVEDQPASRSAMRRWWPWLTAAGLGCVLTGVLVWWLFVSGRPSKETRELAATSKKEPAPAPSNSSPPTTATNAHPQPGGNGPTSTEQSHENASGGAKDRQDNVATHANQMPSKLVTPSAPGATAPVQPVVLNLDEPKTFGFTDEMAIKTAWTFDNGSPAWRIEGDGVRLMDQTAVLQSRFAVSGDAYLEMSYLMPGRRQIVMTIWNEQFEFKIPGHRRIAYLRRKGNTVVFGTKPFGPTTTVKLKSSQEALSTPIVIHVEPTNQVRSKTELLIRGITISKAPLAPAPTTVVAIPRRQVPHAIPSVEGALSVRNGAKRAELLEQGGGNPGSEKAIAEGMRWLARKQDHRKQGGFWRLAGYDGGFGLANDPNHIAATSMALLALMAGGNHPRNGTYAAEVRKGLFWLERKQRGDGAFGGETLYEEALATMAMCEGFGMSGLAIYKPKAQRAVDYLVHAQQPGGGWGKQIGERGNTRVTSWVFMALTTARMAGLQVPEQALKRASRFLDSVQAPNGGFGNEERRSQPLSTAMGLLCRQYLGWEPKESDMQAGANILKRKPPAVGLNDIYYYYFATQVMHNIGGPEWDAWNAKMRDWLTARQDKASGNPKKDRAWAGSWPPFDDENGRDGGRLMVTSLSLLTLEVYYRYAPLAQPEAKGQ